MNNPFDYIPDTACERAFRELVARLELLKSSGNDADVSLCRELESGKMLGVLIAADGCGKRHTLYAFSGQLGDTGFRHPLFVEPVFDYLRPDGYFKTKEWAISRLNVEIARFEKDSLSPVEYEYRQAKSRLDAEVEEYREMCRVSKLERAARRAAGVTDEAELAEMVRRSQFEKAELHRLKKRAATALQPLTFRLKEAQTYLETLRVQRRSDSESLQRWLFSNFNLLNACGESRSLSDIFASTPMGVPPSGAGECCAPKLLQAAYVRGWRPLAMAEYWYGEPKMGEVRHHGEHYPACRGKCLPVLTWMLQGLAIDPPLGSDCREDACGDPEILYENRWFCVVNKPSGMLSVPGKGESVSVEEWLAARYAPGRSVRMVHRLDQDTSGLLIAAFGPLSYKVLQSLFAMRKVNKRYVAELEGDYVAVGVLAQGRVELPLSPDWLDRPRQRVDLDGGKEAVTDYEFISVSDGRSRIYFYPLTGRTHQLRVHAASEMGLGMPIVGDRLYGKDGRGTSRLLLHAQRIEFTFPIDGLHYCFEASVPF